MDMRITTKTVTKRVATKMVIATATVIANLIAITTPMFHKIVVLLGCIASVVTIVCHLLHDIILRIDVEIADILPIVTLPTVIDLVKMTIEVRR